MSQTHKPRRKPPTAIPAERTVHEAEIIDTLDELLEEIDDLLEQEDEFLLRYRQRGGQ